MTINFIFCTKKTRNINYRINYFKEGLKKYEKIFKYSNLNKSFYFVLGNNSIVNKKTFNSNVDFNNNYICLGSSPYQNMGKIKNLPEDDKAHNLILFGSNRYDKLFTSFDILPNRWNEFRKKYNIVEENYKINRDGYILYTLSNAIGWFGQHKEKNWIQNIDKNLKKIRQKTKRKIVIRLHPNNISYNANIEKKCPGFKKFINNLKKKYEFNNTQPLGEIKNDIYAAFVVNGSICVELTCYGIPIFCIDKSFDKFICSKIAIKNLDLINNLQLEHLDNSKKTQFLEWVCSNCFFRTEIKNGALFKKIYEILSKKFNNI
jgi:hypothetical protein